MVPHGPLYVTSLSLGSGRLHLVARCDRCGVLAERTLFEHELVHVIATEALAARGCVHAEEVMRVGARGWPPRRGG